MDRLKETAIVASKIRRRIKEEVALLKSEQQSEEQPMEESNSRLGLKYSTRASNLEGLLEKEIQARSQTEQIPGCRYRKRRLNELRSHDIDAIVHCYRHELLSQREVA